MPGGTAVVGIGATEFSKDSGRSELRLAVEAITAALADAGLTAVDVDGLVTFTMDGNAEIAVARELGLRELRFLDQVGYGGGAACATVQHAAMAVATGTADVVVCYRALNERSGRRFGQVASGLAGVPTTAGVDNGWHYPMGLATPAAMVAMIARRYMHEHGAGSEDFGRVTVAARRHAANNPGAWFYRRPVTLAEHQESRWIAEPLRLLDCCQESDGAVAVVVTSLDRARDLPRRPARIAAAAQGSGPGQYIMTSYYRDELAALPEMGVVAGQLWRQAGIGPADVRTAMLYDHFTPYVLIQLEELGFCARGEARHFIADGAIELGGRLPLNTHGGQLGEAYIHGMNGIAEAVRQVRGTSVNQVAGDGPVLVTAGTGVPTSGLILSLARFPRGPAWQRIADGPRAEDAQRGPAGEVLLRRHDAGEGAEEAVGLLPVGGHGREEAELAGGGRGEGGQAEGEVVDAADRPVAPPLVVAQCGREGTAAAKAGDDGGGEVVGVAQRAGHALRRDRVHDDARVAGQGPAGTVRPPEHVRLVGRGAEPFRPAATADAFAQVAALVEGPQAVTLQVGPRRRELGHRCRHVDHGEIVVGGEDRHRAPRPLVELAARDGDAGPVGIAGERQRGPLAVPARADRVRHERPLPVGPDDQARAVGHDRAAAGAAPDPGDPVTGGRQLRHPEVLAHLRAGLARRVDQDGIEQRPPRAQQRVHPGIRGEPAVHDHATAGVEAHPAHGRGARRRQPAQQAPLVQPGDTRDLELM